MNMSLERSSVQNMPVLMRSKRPACMAGIMGGMSMRMKTGSRHSFLATALPSSTFRPCNSPFSSTNCCGGSVGLMDICSLPGVTS